jgi:hypothetical protein
MRTRAALAAVAIALAVPATGAAGDDDDEEENESVTRVSCAGGSAELRLSGEDHDDDEDDDGGDRIAVELRVDVRRPVLVWRIVLVHERRLVYRGTRRWSRPRYSLRLAGWVPDWAGRQTVTARLTTGAGRTCRLEATI